MSIKNKNAANHLSGRKRAAGRLLSPACGLLVFATCATAVFSAQAQPQPQPTQQADVQTFAIPAGDLTPALQSLASSARVILTFTPEQTRGKSTAGLQGRYGLSEAFSRLLAGSGLRQLKLGTTSAPILSARRRSAPLKPSTRLYVLRRRKRRLSRSRSHPRHPARCRAATARHTVINQGRTDHDHYYATAGL